MWAYLLAAGNLFGFEVNISDNENVDLFFLFLGA